MGKPSVPLALQDVDPSFFIIDAPAFYTGFSSSEQFQKRDSMVSMVPVPKQVDARTSPRILLLCIMRV